MKLTTGAIAAVFCGVLLAGTAVAQDSVRFGSTWLGGGDTVMEIQATADWYKAVFGMRETNRFGTGVGRSLGIRLAFGLNHELARASKDVAMGVTTSYLGPPGARNDEFVRIAFAVKDMDAIKRRAVEHGGSIKSEPVKQGGETVMLLKDPRGNVVEVFAARNADAAAVEWRVLRIAAVDADKTAQFYKKVFGMREVSRTGSKAAPEILLDVAATSTSINTKHPLLAIATVRVMPRPTMTTSASQITWGWSGLSEIETMLERAVEFSPTYLRSPFYAKGDGLTYVRFTDPAGNVVEFAGNCKAGDGQGNEISTAICRGEQ
jgi:predicted enzyme related to lactoylglutathione lyase